MGYFNTSRAARDEWRRLQRWFDWDNLANWSSDPEEDWDGNLEEYGPFSRGRCYNINERYSRGFRKRYRRMRERHWGLRYLYSSRCPECFWFNGSEDEIVTREGIEMDLRGELPGDRHLAGPLKVKISYDAPNFIISEELYHHWGNGATPKMAIANFKNSLVSVLEMLSSREVHLSDYLREQLEYLRSIISND